MFSFGQNYLADETNERLLEHYVQGNKYALRVLHERLRRTVQGLVSHFLRDEKKWIRSRREDACLETWLRIAFCAHTFEARSKFLTWLGRIAMRACAVHARRLRAAREVQAKEAPEGVPSVFEAVLDPRPLLVESLSRKEAQEDVDFALSSLSPELEAAFLLRVKDALNWQEIGARLGLTRFAARRAARRAASLLKFLVRRHDPQRV